MDFLVFFAGLRAARRRCGGTLSPVCIRAISRRGSGKFAVAG
jgi:hypothetical protein